MRQSKQKKEEKKYAFVAREFQPDNMNQIFLPSLTLDMQKEGGGLWSPLLDHLSGRRQNHVKPQELKDCRTGFLKRSFQAV